MRIFQVDFSRLGTTQELLNWLTTEGINGGKNCERYWIVRTNVSIQSPHEDLAIRNLSIFLDMAQKHNYQSVLITKNA